MNLFESFAKGKKSLFQPKTPSRPSIFPLFFLPRRLVRFPLPQPASHSSRPSTSPARGPSPRLGPTRRRPLPSAANRRAPPVGVVFLPVGDADSGSPAAARLPAPCLGAHSKDPRPPLFIASPVFFAFLRKPPPPFPLQTLAPPLELWSSEPPRFAAPLPPLDARASLEFLRRVRNAAPLFFTSLPLSLARVSSPAQPFRPSPP